MVATRGIRRRRPTTTTAATATATGRASRRTDLPTVLLTTTAGFLSHVARRVTTGHRRRLRVRISLQLLRITNTHHRISRNKRTQSRVIIPGADLLQPRRLNRATNKTVLIHPRLLRATSLTKRRLPTLGHRLRSISTNSRVRRALPVRHQPRHTRSRTLRQRRTTAIGVEPRPTDGLRRRIQPQLLARQIQRRPRRLTTNQRRAIGAIDVRTRQT